MWIVWAAYHKGVSLLGVPGITLDSVSKITKKTLQEREAVRIFVRHQAGFFRGSFFDFQAGSFWDSSGSLLKTGKLQVFYLCLSRVGHWTFFFIFVLRHLPCVPLLGLSHSPWLVQIQMDCPISTGATSTDEGPVFFSKLQWRMFSEPWKVLKFAFLVFLFWIHTLLHLQWANVDHAWLCPSGMFCWYGCNEFWFATRRSAAATAVFSNLAGGKRLFAPRYCTDSTDAVQSFRGHLSCLELNTISTLHDTKRTSSRNHTKLS